MRDLHADLALICRKWAICEWREGLLLGILQGLVQVLKDGCEDKKVLLRRLGL